jgi:hypothetical protein
MLRKRCPGTRTHSQSSAVAERNNNSVSVLFCTKCFWNAMRLRIAFSAKMCPQPTVPIRPRTNRDTKFFIAVARQVNWSYTSAGCCDWFRLAA